MNASVPPLQLAHLVLEGAVMSLCLELIVRTLFVARTQRSFLVRTLKVIMALAMIIKSSVFAAFSSSNLRNHCKVVGRIADSFYHIGCIAGICILLLRVKVIVQPSHQKFFYIIHCFILSSRVVLGILDIVYVHIWTDSILGVCRYKDKHEIGIAYTIYDTAIDIYVSIVVSAILITHIRRLSADHINGNINLYLSVVSSNVIRTIILSIVNLVCTVYYITANDNPTMVLIVWPISNMFLTMLVGYDTNITNSINQLGCHVFPVYGSQPSAQTHKGGSQQGSLSSILDRPINIPVCNDKEKRPFRSRTTSICIELASDIAADPAHHNETSSSSSCTVNIGNTNVLSDENHYNRY